MTKKRLRVSGAKRAVLAQLVPQQGSDLAGKARRAGRVDVKKRNRKTAQKWPGGQKEKWSRGATVRVACNRKGLRGRNGWTRGKQKKEGQTGGRKICRERRPSRHSRSDMPKKTSKAGGGATYRRQIRRRRNRHIRKKGMPANHAGGERRTESKK